MMNFGVRLSAETDAITRDVNIFLDITGFLLKYGWLIFVAMVIIAYVLKEKKQKGKAGTAQYTENFEDDEEEDPWAWKREYDRRRRYEAQREARREERRMSRYDDYGYDEERETHYGEEHDVDESVYCHDCDCEEDDLI